MKSLIKTGFGLGIGLMAAQILFLLLGAALFVPGYLMYNNKQNKDDQTNKVFGIVLMFLGVVIMGGIGFTILVESFSGLFE